MHRPIIIVLTASLFSFIMTLATSATDRPNILVILADDMGYGDIKALNLDSKIPTPHLDKLAAGGAIFTDAHSGSAVYSHPLRTLDRTLLLAHSPQVRRPLSSE